MSTEELTQSQKDAQALEHFQTLVRLARTDFLAYVLLFNNPQTSNIILGDLHKFLIRKVQGVVDGTCSPFQCVSVPPQFGKSTILSKEAVSWMMGRSPGINIGMAGHRFDLMVEFSQEVKDRVEHPWYQLVFPGTGIMPGRNKADSWACGNGSSLRAKTVGSKFTGNRVDYLILDDVHAGREEAESETQRRRVHNWFFADCVSRLSPGAKIFLIGTRWHPKDLIGHVTRDEYVNQLQVAGQTERIFEVTNLPALAGQNDPLGRAEGESLFPEVRSTAWLEGVRMSIPAYEWESQYQGNPRSISAGQVDVSKIKRITALDVPRNIPRARGWDLALTEKQTADFSVGMLCAYDRDTEEFYIMDMFRKRLAWPKLKRQVINISLDDKAKHNANKMGLEAVSGFEIGLQELRKSLLGQVSVEKRNPPKGGKLMRAQDWLNAVEAERVSIVEGSWNKDFLDELTDFPNGSADDAVDATSIAWESLVRRGKLLFA